MYPKTRQHGRLARWLSPLLAVLLLAAGMPVCLAAAADTVAPSAVTPSVSDGVTGYLQYRQAYTEKPVGTQTLVLPAENAVVQTGEAVVVKEDRFAGGCALRTEEESVVEWRFALPNAGLYTLTLDVTTQAANKSTAQRELRIDGALPFEELAGLSFYRMWEDIVHTDGFDIDSSGNQVRPQSEAVDRLVSETLRDSTGLPYELWLDAGEHTLALTGIRERLVIDSLTLAPASSVPSWKDVKGTVAYTSEAPIVIEAEKPLYKSDYSIYPVYDRTSAITSPQSASAIVLNTIGRTNWQSVGQWIEWEVEAAASGWYQLSFRYKQENLQGVYVSRRLTVDGGLPWKEAAALRFPYSPDWSLYTPADEEGDAYAVYLEAGTHTLRLEVVLGGLYPIVEKASRSLEQLNILYRNILSVTGTSPDVNRDYDFEDTMPEVLDGMAAQAALLQELEGYILGETGQSGEMAALLRQLYFQLNKMVQKPYEIAKQFTVFKSNISALGDWINNMSNQPMELDYILLSNDTDEKPPARESFFRSLAFNAQLFIQSFLSDYTGAASGNGGDVLSIWMTSGRDQMQILSTLIINEFTGQKGIPVHLKLVTAGTLLPSTLSGRGPDVALTNFTPTFELQSEPVDYALRNAVLDLTRFSDLDEVLQRFPESAVVPFRYRGGLYALPETLIYPMLFYRADIFEEQGLQPPETWDELTAIIPTLKRRNMTAGMQAGYAGFLNLLYQRDAGLYKEDGYHTNLDSNEAIAAFKQLCDLFTLYKLPVEYDAANRFRSGEMPLMIANYSLYNQLAVFAPEIRGQWGMLPIPGLRREDGTVSHAAVSMSTGSMILRATEHPEEAWEFLKWWTSADVQAKFGVEMEALLGPAAKHATANMEALEQLPWTKKEYEALMRQRDASCGLPTVPGYYQAQRMLGFAFQNAYNENTDPVTLLEDQIISIHTELERRHEEFS